MIDLFINKTIEDFSVGILDVRLKTIHPDTIYGISSGVQITIHAKDGTSQAIQDDLVLAVEQHDTLTVNATASTILPDGVAETVVTCAELPTTFDYNIIKGVDLIASGTINDGSLELSINEEGEYIIELIDGYRTGYVKVSAING